MKSPALRSLLFRTVAAVLPVALIIGLAEFGPWSRSTSYNPRFLVPHQSHLVDNYQFTWRFFPRSLARSPQPLHLDPSPAQNDRRRRRYVVLGESAAMGDPEPAFGLPRMLQAVLEARFPDDSIEVVNAAVTAINSHTLVSIARDLAALPADGWVLYAGNNEVYGPFGAGTVFGAKTPPLWWVRLQLAARTTRTGQWLQARQEAAAVQDGTPSSWRGMEMFLDAPLPASSPALARVNSSWSANLDTITRLARRHGRRLVLSAAAVNLLDCPPLGGHPPADPADTAPRSSTETIDQETLRQQHHAHPEDAEITWRLARSLWTAEQTRPEAVSLFHQARDLDPLRFRCDSVLTQSVETVAARHSRTRDNDLTLVHAQQSLDAAAPGQLAGNEFFYEHVHLTPAGAHHLAVLMAQALLQTREGQWATLDECRQRLGLTPWHDRQMWQEMRNRLRRPPFTRQWGAAERLAAIDQKLNELTATLTPEHLRAHLEESLAFCSRFPLDWHLRRQTAALADAAGRREIAIQLLTQAATLMPHHTSDQLLGAALTQAGQPAAAIPHLRQAVATRPSYAQAWHSLGIALARSHAPDEAEAALTRALSLHPHSPEILRSSALLQSQQNRSEEAITLLQRALTLAPADPATRQELGRLLVASGQLEAALPHYQHLADTLPDQSNAHLNLGLLLARLQRPDLARPALERVLQLDPQHALARQTLDQLPP